MGQLTVIRHGQASFLSENYDKLSALGEEQSRLLGEYWIGRGVRFRKIVYGPCERQIRTGEIIGELYRQAGLDWPEPSIDARLDEYPAEAVLRTFGPPLMEKHAGLRELAEAFQSASDVRIRQKAIDGLLREVSQRWIAGEVQSAEIPSWADFCERIRAAVGEAVNGAGSGASVAVFTSGGPTAATARMALGLDDQATLELTWSPRNASFSEFLFSGAGRFTLSTFNNTPHLTDARLHTYR